MADYGLDDFSKDLLRIAEKDYPKETKQFLKKQGNKLRLEVVKQARQDTTGGTGKYKKGFKRGKVYKYQGDTDSVRVYNSQPHAQLIEYGHEIVDRNGVSHGFVKGKHTLDNSAKSFEEKFVNAAETFIDELLEKGL